MRIEKKTWKEFTRRTEANTTARKQAKNIRIRTKGRNKRRWKYDSSDVWILTRVLEPPVSGISSLLLFLHKFHMFQTTIITANNNGRKN